MKQVTPVLLCALLAAPALANTVATHFASEAEALAQMSSTLPFEFVGRLDTAGMTATENIAPGSSQCRPFSLWNSSEPHAFEVVYNGSEDLAGVRLDYGLAETNPVSLSLDPETNGFLITAFAGSQSLHVTMSNLQIVLVGGNGFPLPPVALGAVAAAPATDYLLLELTDLPEGVSLANGFVLGGEVTFTWQGSMAPPDQQWIEVAPVVIPEPTGLGLLGLGGLVLGIRRR
jgi:hypothetical protein